MITTKHGSGPGRAFRRGAPEAGREVPSIRENLIELLHG
jgi:hypothetical protein